MTTREEMRSLAEEIVDAYTDRVATIAELRKTVKTELKELKDARIDLGKELRADLAKSAADRNAAVSTQLKELDAAHAAMSREMRAELNKGRQTLTEEEAKRQSEAREFMGELGKVVAEGKAAVKTLLGEFDSSHNAMSREMRAELSKGRQSLAKGERKRQSEAREFMGELGKAVAEGKAATQALLRDFGEVQAGARDEWQKMTATIQSKRGGVGIKVKPLIGEITPETTTLCNRVFEYLANHPDGTKMTELEQEFSVARIQMAKLLKDLADENKVAKRNSLYFAI
jgi:hypothetical protein